MKRPILFLSLLWIVLGAFAQTEQWALTTDAGVTVTMNNVNAFVAAADHPSTFSILLKEGDALTDVKEAFFAKVAGIHPAAVGKDHVVISTATGLILSNVAPGTEIALYNLMGSRLVAGKATASTFTLSLEPFNPGYYILSIGGSPYKIQRTKP